MADELRSEPYYQLDAQKQVQMQHLWRVMDDIKTAIQEGADIDYVTSLLGGYVQSVTDDGEGIVSVDNTDPQNPVVSGVAGNTFDYLTLGT